VHIILTAPTHVGAEKGKAYKIHTTFFFHFVDKLGCF
jgi:hypothetical protein